jgi:uncharacterized membrane protein YhaH (DUF805 family)
LSWLSLYWGWTGRLNRLQFLLGVYSLAIAGTVALFVFLPLVAPPAPGGGYIATREVWALVWTLQTIPAPFQASMAVRRVHDLGLSAVWVLAWFALVVIILIFETQNSFHPLFEILILMPLIVAAFALVFTAGQPQANRFGPPPRGGWVP